MAKIDLSSSLVTASTILTLANTTISDIDFDSSGNLYLMDRENGEILKVENSTLSTTKLSKDLYPIYPNPLKNINTSELSARIYILKIKTEKGIAIEKLIKQ